MKRLLCRILTLALGLLFCLSGGFLSFASDKTVEIRQLGDPEHAWWDGKGLAHWSSVSGAHEYQVKLYIADYMDIEFDDAAGTWVTDASFGDDDTECAAVIRTSDVTCDFTEYMKDMHSYVYIVRACPKVNETAYVQYGSFVLSPLQEYTDGAFGITTGKWRNFPEGSRYDTGEEYLADGWQLVRGCWYYLSGGGYRQTGWLELADGRYYLRADGKMATGLFMIDDDIYYADENGRVQTGWVMIQPGIYYYMQEDGRAARGTSVDGYDIPESGLCKRG